MEFLFKDFEFRVFEKIIHQKFKLEYTPEDSLG